MLRKEEWKPINKFEEYYLVSSYGRVKSLHYGKELILKPRVTHDGYASINLLLKGTKSYRTIHRLVAQAFIPNTENKPTVNHIDGIKDNNNVSNLEWNTRKEQIQHMLDNNLRTMPRGEDWCRTKLKESTVIKVKEMVRDGYRNYEIMEELDLKYWIVGDIKREKTWSWLKI